MYIKSYRDQTVVNPFSSGLNVVVGRNGSGKSNFFSAIRFVLSDAYTSLSRQERQALLHEGSSTASTFSAYVEIVFDNADQRFPTGHSEVILRRTIGPKKDEYSLDRKTTGKGEIFSLLESAGFSRSNPYYIVPQGRITHITNMKDTDRLELLKEVAGTNVYENRRQESMRIIQDTDFKRAKIEELLAYIEDRLSDLEGEKEELKNFQTSDRERRCLEYAIFSRELDSASDTLNKIEAERADNANEANQRRTEAQERERIVTRLENALVDTRQSIDMLDLERKQLELDRKDAVKARTEVACTIQDLESARSSAYVCRETIETDLRDIRQAISDAETALTEMTPKWEDLLAAERDQRATIDRKGARCNALISKQGRTQHFGTQAARDDFLGSEANRIRAVLHTRVQREAELAKERKNCTEALAHTSRKVAELRSKLDTYGDTLRNSKADLNNLRDEINRSIEQRKALWKEDSILDQRVQHARSEVQNADRNMAATMDKGTAAGLQAAKRIARELELEGFYGPLYELFTVQEAYRTAAEVTAGTSLFHLLVDTDETASKILNAMMQQRAGRATFMPLNRLRSNNWTYPETDTNAKDENRVIPLIDKLDLHHSSRDRKAFEQVFGRTVVCSQLRIGAPLVRSHGLSIITPEGDRIDRKGALTGGFHDVRRSRLDAIERSESWNVRYSDALARHIDVKQQIAEFDQSITQLSGKVTVAETRIRQVKEARASFADTALDLQRDEEQQNGRRDRLVREHRELLADIKRLEAQLHEIQSEIATPLANSLSEAEIIEFDQLTSEAVQHNRWLADLTESRIEIEKRKSLLEIDLRESLSRRHEELQSRLDRFDTEGVGTDGKADQPATLEAQENEYQSLGRSVAALSERINDLEVKADQALSLMHQHQTDLDRTREAQVEDSRNVSRQQKAVERYHARRRVAQQRKDDCNAKIRELGVLPEQAFAGYKTESLEQLFKSLHKQNEILKKFTHVNKKAFEQYNNFTKQREDLLDRQNELDRSYDSIKELIHTLDLRKDEAIERTFRQVSQYFSEIFAKIVPAGRGRLIMQKRLDQDEGHEEMDVNDRDNDRPTKKAAIESYTGVSIKISFNSKSDEGMRIQQLSGGQKSVVALAIVFAIQKCDPAPFYLFDEIDANLDADRRTAIASMIQELAERAQFVVTTFRPELLVHAHNHLGVVFNERKVSSIKQLTADNAREFVEANERVVAGENSV